MINIFVSMLSKHTTAAQLEQIFAQYGHVVSTKLIQDKKTGLSKRYAFVEMEDRDAAHAAIMNLDGAVLDGQNIAVKEAEVVAKPRRNNHRGGGGSYNRDSRRPYDSGRPQNRDSRRPYNSGGQNKDSRDSSPPNFNRRDDNNRY